MWLRSIFLKTLRDYRVAILGWGLGIGVLVPLNFAGFSTFVATLPPAAAAIAEMCDGSSTRDEICREFQRRYDQELPRASLDQLLDQLDEALLMESPRFTQHVQGMFAEYARSPVRAPSQTSCYPWYEAQHE